MSYKIYISRAADPSRSSETPITLNEWVSLVKDIPDLHLQAADARPLPGQPTYREGLVRWASHPFGTPVWFTYENGAIVAEYPDAYTAMRMRNLANRLHARLHGW